MIIINPNLSISPGGTPIHTSSCSDGAGIVCANAAEFVRDAFLMLPALEEKKALPPDREAAINFFTMSTLLILNTLHSSSPNQTDGDHSAPSRKWPAVKKALMKRDSMHTATLTLAAPVPTASDIIRKNWNVLVEIVKMLSDDGIQVKGLDQGVESTFPHIREKR